jgi:DNA-binding NarL/FixJ family response regulator
VRTLIDLAIERLHLAGMGDASWKEALAAVGRAVQCDRAFLFTPELAPDAGGLSAIHDTSASRGLRDVCFQPQESDEVYSHLLTETGDRTMPATLFVVLRACGTPFAPEERRSMGLIARHAAAAVRLWFRTRACAQGAEALSSSLNAAVLIVDAEARVAWMNHRANAWAQGRRLVVARGRLTEIAGVALDLARAIRDAAERRCASAVTVSADITIEMAPVAMPRGNATSCGKAVLVLLRDRNDCRQVAALLAESFRLTSTEVDLAIALWKGVLVGEYAQQRCVAMSTVRTQLKSLLAKTRSRRQSDVVALVGRMLPLLGNPSLAALDLMAEPHPGIRGTSASRDRSNG